MRLLHKVPRKALVVGLAVTIAASTATVAAALITSTSGSVIRLASAPVSVRLNALENATSVYAFDERQGVTLASAVSVDAVNPGTYSSFPSGNSKIGIGTVVDSHMIHSDIPSRGYTTRRTGSVTYSSDILGVIASTSRLASSDGLGAPGTLYAGTTQWRGLEGGESWINNFSDKFTISNDHRTLSFDIGTGVMDEMRVVTKHQDLLTTTIIDSPHAVSAGNDVQYTITVTNNGTDPVANASVADTLPAGTTLKTAPVTCTGTGPVTCALGTIAGGGSAQVQIIVTSPGTVPSGGTITDSAVASPGNNGAGTVTTNIEAPQPGVSKGFVSPGGSLTIGGNDPATVTLPNTGAGAPIEITQDTGTFCPGGCNGPATTISPFDGYSDPANPIRLSLTYNYPHTSQGIFDAAIALSATIYKSDESNVVTVVPFCSSFGSGVAAPHPCLDARSIVDNSPTAYTVSFEILYLSGDPRFAKH